MLLLFHPDVEGDDVYGALYDDVDRWLVVHVGMMVFIPLFAVAIYLLVRGRRTRRRVCRIALAPFVLFYTAWEVLLGIGTGVLVQDVNGLPPDERATGSDLVNEFTDNIPVRDFGIFVSIGGLSLITATIAAGIALRRQSSVPVAVPILLGLCGFLIAAHPPPTGPIGLVLLIAAVLLYARSQLAEQAPAPTKRPNPT